MSRIRLISPAVVRPKPATPKLPAPEAANQASASDNAARAKA